MTHAVRRPLLEARELGIRFGGVQAAKGVSLEVGELEIVGIIGPNGAGKTTTFNMLSGFYEPDEGRVLLDGRDVTALPVHKRAALGLGRTFQNVGLVKGATVRQNLLTAQHLHVRYGLLAGLFGGPTIRSEERRLSERADTTLELLDLTHLADKPVQGLPYGDLKRVEIAAVVATDPLVLLLDEPSSGMGPEEAHRLGDSLLGLRRDLGLAIAMIEHHVPLVVRACDHVYCLSFGQLLAAGRPEAVRDDPLVVEAYLGRPTETQQKAEKRKATVPAPALTTGVKG